MVRQILLLLIGLACASAAQAATLVLKDGTFVDGTILVQTQRTVRLKTKFGVRSYNRREIEEIIESVDYADADSVNRFDQLPEALKAVLNGRADYDLGRYDRVLERLAPFRDDQEDGALRVSMDWLAIETQERLGNWEKAKKLLEEKKKNGGPKEKLRAKAHLDIFEWNPDYDLRYIFETHARNFLVAAKKELRDRGREPNSLRHRDIMEAALKQYCEQLLRRDGFSVPALEEAMNPRRTFEALENIVPRGDLEKHLPYADLLKRAEASVSKAQTVFPAYADIYEIQLFRVEISHLLDVWDPLSQRAMEVMPVGAAPASDPQTGRLTRAGREELIAACDDFIVRAGRVVAVLEYIQEKVQRYPVKLKSAFELHRLVIEHHKDMIRWAKKLRRKDRV